MKGEDSTDSFLESRQDKEDTQPDAVLADMQSPLRKVVALVDAQVIGGDNFEVGTL